MLYIAIGILGATVMPHNLYLHSAIVQTRDVDDNPGATRQAIRYATFDSTVALLFAFFINAAILILSAAAFNTSGNTEVADINDAFRLLTPLLGASLAGILFAVALLASGQNSTITGTLAGQIVMEGFPGHPPAGVAAPSHYPAHRDRTGGDRHRDVRRARRRRAADPQPGDPQPAALLRGDPAGHLHQRQAEDGAFANGPLLKAAAWAVALVIAGLNVWLLIGTFRTWIA
jgi:manganese transport protein